MNFWIQHRALHVLATSAMDTPRLTYQDFLRSLQSSIDTSNEMAFFTFNILGRDLTRSDMEADDVVCIFSSCHIILTCVIHRDHMSLQPFVRFVHRIKYRSFEFLLSRRTSAPLSSSMMTTTCPLHVKANRRRYHGKIRLSRIKKNMSSSTVRKLWLPRLCSGLRRISSKGISRSLVALRLMKPM